MLSLFKDAEVPLAGRKAEIRCREIFMTSLNQGHIPSWDQLLPELPVLESSEDLESIKMFYEELTEWNFLKDHLDKPSTEFFFHSPDSCQRLDLSGCKYNFSVPLKEDEWQLWLEIISIKFKQNWNVQNPCASFYGAIFGRNYRFTLIHGSTSPKGISKLVLRVLSSTPYPISSFGNAAVLESLVNEKKNMLIAGSTGSGKTSLLASLLQYVPESEHLVILEDTYEIMTERNYETRFLSGSSPETTLKSFLSYSLRLSPDRIILGEMRSHEVVPFVMAMNTGHRGLMGTVHASSGVDAINRIALLFTLYSGEANLPFDKVMELICRNLETVVFMEGKKIKNIIKILGCDQGVPFYESLL